MLSYDTDTVGVRYLNWTLWGEYVWHTTGFTNRLIYVPTNYWKRQLSFL